MASAVTKTASMTAWRRKHRQRDVPRKLSEHLDESMDAIAIQSVVETPETVPPVEQWRDHGTVQKRTMDHTAIWQDRRIVITRDALFFTRLESEVVLDFVWLHEIASVDSLDLQDTRQSSDDQTDDNTAAQASGEGAGKYGILDESDSCTELAKKLDFRFDIYKTATNRNSGRCYSLRCASAEDQKRWVTCLRRGAERARTDFELSKLEHSNFKLLQARLRRWYESNSTQYAVATVIILSFVTHILAVERVPERHSGEDRLYKGLDHAFTALFTVELMINLTANWFRPFFRSGWNLFDAWVVFISLVSIAAQDVAGFNLLRLFRVFRVLRLFKRLVALRSIINALTASIVPVANSFVVLVLVSCMYAVIAVDLFKEREPELFGSFFPALFTMFQVCTGDGWAISVARPLAAHEENSDNSRWIYLFFVSYVLLVGTVLINVVVAVILDEFISAVAVEKEQKAQVASRAAQQRHAGCLDPLLLSLSRSHSIPEFDRQVERLHQALDLGMNGAITQEELRVGLSRLSLEQRLQLSVEDCEVLTASGRLCDERGCLDLAAFRAMVAQQFSDYAQRRLELAMEEAEGSETSTVLFALKLLTMSGLASAASEAPGSRPGFKLEAHASGAGGGAKERVGCSACGCRCGAGAVGAGGRGAGKAEEEGESEAKEAVLGRAVEQRMADVNAKLDLLLRAGGLQASPSLPLAEHPPPAPQVCRAGSAAADAERAFKQERPHTTSSARPSASGPAAALEKAPWPSRGVGTIAVASPAGPPPHPISKPLTSQAVAQLLLDGRAATPTRSQSSTPARRAESAAGTPQPAGGAGWIRERGREGLARGFARKTWAGVQSPSLQHTRSPAAARREVGLGKLALAAVLGGPRGGIGVDDVREGMPRTPTRVLGRRRRFTVRC